MNRTALLIWGILLLIFVAFLILFILSLVNGILVDKPDVLKLKDLSYEGVSLTSDEPIPDDEDLYYQNIDNDEGVGVIQQYVLDPYGTTNQTPTINYWIPINPNKEQKDDNEEWENSKYWGDKFALFLILTILSCVACGALAYYIYNESSGNGNMEARTKNLKG